MATEYAVRYARALVDVLETSHADIEAAGGELGEFEAAWRESAGLRDVFLDPSIPAGKKVAILDKLNARLGMSKPVRNLLAVIVNHERMEGFEAILEEFRRMVREDLGIDKVEWTSVRPLNEDERRAVEAKVAELTGKRIEATFREDKALLGGALLRIGSTIYDGSVRGRLDGMREKLTN
jgi:F-type H+-transporting ATPase subunit delta